VSNNEFIKTHHFLLTTHEFEGAKVIKYKAFPHLNETLFVKDERV
jgi:hypothetical protein